MTFPAGTLEASDQVYITNWPGHGSAGVRASDMVWSEGGGYATAPGNLTLEQYIAVKHRHNSLRQLFYDGHGESMEWETFYPNRDAIWNRTVMWP